MWVCISLFQFLFLSIFSLSSLAVLYILLLSTHSHFARKRWWLMTNGNTFFPPQWSQRGSLAWELWIEGKQSSHAASTKLNAVLKDHVFCGFSKGCTRAFFPTRKGLVSCTPRGKEVERARYCLRSGCCMISQGLHHRESWPWKMAYISWKASEGARKTGGVQGLQRQENKTKQNKMECVECLKLVGGTGIGQQSLNIPSADFNAFHRCRLG